MRNSGNEGGTELCIHLLLLAPCIVLLSTVPVNPEFKDPLLPSSVNIKFHVFRRKFFGYTEWERAKVSVGFNYF